MASPAAGALDSREISEEQISLLAGKLMAKRGHDLLSYKGRMLRRRIQVRMRARSCGDVSEYMRLLDRDPAELDSLVKALVIHVSGFFRNRETFWFLRDKVFPGLLKRKAECGTPLMILSAGCAAGEEPASLAILIRHYFRRQTRGLQVRIVGMDVDDDILEIAREAVYPAERLKDVPDDLRSRYFSGSEKLLRLDPEIRDMVEFAAGDFSEGLGLSGIDMIMCRNMLIYYNRERQRKVLGVFSDSLAPGGYLVLGKTESVMRELRSGFEAVNISEHIYRKSGEEPCGWR